MNTNLKNILLQVRKYHLLGNTISPIEEQLEETCNQLVDRVTPLHGALAPDCFDNMTLFGDHGCRVGKTEKKAYSGVTCVLDFCAHSHRDDSNMVGGCTAIVTLTKVRYKHKR